MKETGTNKQKHMIFCFSMRKRRQEWLCRWIKSI